jgi:hypothetical protein
MYGIKRVDHAASRTHAWVVRIQRRGRIHHRYFTDSLYGGKRNALEAAIRHRDHLTATLRPLSRRGFCSIKKKNNRSGIVGVARITKIERKQHRTWQADFWVAVWPIAGNRSRQKKFSVKKYGERQALRLAMNARKVALRNL